VKSFLQAFCRSFNSDFCNFRHCPPATYQLLPLIFLLAWFFEGRAYSRVSQKECVLDAISELPDEVSLQKIVEKIEFLAAIRNPENPVMP
jgi:hypothetical protein